MMAKVQLQKYHLNLEKTARYVKEHLTDGNTLSKELLKVIHFEEGSFFTLLPSGIPDSVLYHFEYADDLGWKNYEPQIKGNKPIRELSNHLLQKMEQNHSLSCIFEDVEQSPTDPHVEHFHSHGLLYNKEIYYLVKPTNVSYDLISECIWESGAIWHFVCILTSASFDYKKDKILRLEKIKEACLLTEAVVVIAYDEFGYIFWEKKNKQ